MVGPFDLGSDFGSNFDGLQNFGVIRYPPNNLRSPNVHKKKNKTKIENQISINERLHLDK